MSTCVQINYTWDFDLKSMQDVWKYILIVICLFEQA